MSTQQPGRGSNTRGNHPNDLGQFVQLCCGPLSNIRSTRASKRSADAAGWIIEAQPDAKRQQGESSAQSVAH
jgi:hypothetical protein